MSLETTKKNLWRKKNTKYRNKARKVNYDKTKPKIRQRRLWTQNELRELFWSLESDGIISIRINRSIQAIQSMRYKINKVIK